jgi:hypothetical protein
MDERDWLGERFEEHRSRLRAVAYRMLVCDNAERVSVVRGRRRLADGRVDRRCPAPEGVAPLCSDTGCVREGDMAVPQLATSRVSVGNDGNVSGQVGDDGTRSGWFRARDPRLTGAVSIPAVHGRR